MPVLELEALRYERAAFAIDLALSLEEGESGVVLGASGCGKSTLLRLIAGFLKPVGGAIMLGGRRVDGLPPEKRRIGMVFQGDALFPSMSARANIEYGPKIAGIGVQKRRIEAEAIARSFGMGDLLDRMPRSLSGGERQRVALARTLAARPDLLLFDEALSALDSESRRSLASEISRRTKQAGLASLHVTHDIDEALDIADRIFMMDKGRIIETGSPRQLFERPTMAATARFLGGGPLIPLSGREGGYWLCGKDAYFNCGKFDEPFPSSHEDRRFLFFPSTTALRISSSDALENGANVIRARVASIAYRGSRIEILARLNLAEVEWRFELPVKDTVSIGEELIFRLPPSATSIVRET